MNRLKIIALAAVIAFYIFPSCLNAQVDEFEEFDFSINTMKLPMPPLKGEKSAYPSLDDEVATIMDQALQDLRLWDIIVGVYFDSALQSQDSTIHEELIVNFKELEGYSEAIVILGSDIFQQGVPPEKDEAYFSIEKRIWGNKAKTGEEKYSKNIQTQLSVFAQFINIENGESLGTLELEVFHTGGSSKKSRTKTMKRLKEKALYEFKRIYWFSSDVITTKNKKTGLPRGTNSGVHKGIIFELVEPDRIWTIDGEEFINPGGSAAIATVVDTSADSSGLKILRQWREYSKDCWAVEYPFPIWAIQLNYSPPSSANSYSNFAILLQAQTIQNFGVGFGMQAIKVADSYGDDDYGFGFSGFGLWRFLNTSKIDLGGKFGLDLDFPFRKDDDGQTVHALLLSANIGMTAEFLLSAKWDLAVNAGYRFAAKTDTWEYSEDEDMYDAYWEENAPEIINSGFLFSFGIRYLIF